METEDRIVKTLTAVACFLASCSFAIADTCVYVSIAGKKTIAVYAMNDKTGALTHRHDVSIDGEPGALATGPKGRFLFASHRSTGQISSFRIHPKTGNLKRVSTVPAGADPAFVAPDRTGKFLLSAYYRAGKAVVHRIGEDGKLDPKPIQTVKTDEKAHAILADASNRFVFVPHTGPNAIFQFHFNARSGKLSPNNVAKVGTGKNTGPRHLAFLPGRNVVYFDNEQGSSVTAYRMNAKTGQLRPFQTLSTLPKDFSARNSCAHVELTPNGKFLYAANRGHDSLAGFAVNTKTGKLTSMGQTPTEQTPRSFNVEPGGRFLFAAGQRSGKLAAYRINPNTGALKRIATYTVGNRPWWVLAVRLPE